jgi:phospholipid/cholesterol/gamma-HCH transport system substrate-binding protein
MEMKQHRVEVIVGLFVILGVLCFGYLSIRFARMEVGGGQDYQLQAAFADLGGLRIGANVEVAGVPVGRVVSFGLSDSYVGEAVLSVRNGVRLPVDTVAAVKTKGLIGEKFISLQPGNAAEMLAAGDRIRSTESGSLELPFGEVKVAGGDTYRLAARFTHLGGLRVGAPVEVAGVPVGRVRQIELDKNFTARVTLDIGAGLELSSDTFASIRTKGLIGGKYILLEPGGVDDLLRDGGEIEETESAFDIESIVSRLVQGNVK